MWISLRYGCKRHNGAGRFRHCGACAPQPLHAKSNPEPVTDNAPDLQLAALNNLGLMYANGQGVPQDFAQALHCYQQAAERGAAQAQSNLAVM